MMIFILTIVLFALHGTKRAVIMQRNQCLKERDMCEGYKISQEKTIRYLIEREKS